MAWSWHEPKRKKVWHFNLLFKRSFEVRLRASDIWSDAESFPERTGPNSTLDFQSLKFSCFPISADSNKIHFFEVSIERFNLNRFVLNSNWSIWFQLLEFNQQVASYLDAKMCSCWNSAARNRFGAICSRNVCFSGKLFLWIIEIFNRWLIVQPFTVLSSSASSLFSSV